MKKLNAVSVIFCFMILGLAVENTAAESAKSFESKKYDVGFSVGRWMTGDVSIERTGYYSYDASKDNSTLIRGFADMYAAPSFAVGIYMNYSPSVEYTDVSVSQKMLEFGMSLKPRLILNQSIALKPGLNIGYRKYSSSDEVGDGVDAMGLNLSIELQIMLANGMIFSIEPGFLAQPVGGNDIISMSFAPIWYVAVGVTF